MKTRTESLSHAFAVLFHSPVSIYTSSLIIISIMHMMTLLTTFRILSSTMPPRVKELHHHYHLLNAKKMWYLKNLWQPENLSSRDLEGLQTESLILLLGDSVFRMVAQKLLTLWAVLRNHRKCSDSILPSRWAVGPIGKVKKKCKTDR